MSPQIGIWFVNVDGREGTIEIDTLDLQGNLTGAINGVRFNGLWSEREAKLTFAIRGSDDPDSLQVFTGYLFYDKLGLGPYLTGSVEFFSAGGGTPAQPVRGWWATGPSIWRPIGPGPVDVNEQPWGRAPWAGRVLCGAYSPSIDVQGIEALFIGIDGGGIWRSTDFRSHKPTWLSILDDVSFGPQDVDGLFHISALAVDPHNPQIIYAGTGGFDGSCVGLLQSKDAGATWTLLDPKTFPNVHSGGGTSGITRIFVDPADATGSTIYVLGGRGPSGSGIFKSTNGGTNFSMTQSGIPDSAVITDISYVSNVGLTLYAGIVSADPTTTGIWISSDHGGTWSGPMPLTLRRHGRAARRDQAGREHPVRMRRIARRLRCAH